MRCVRILRSVGLAVTVLAAVLCGVTASARGGATTAATAATRGAATACAAGTEVRTDRGPVCGLSGGGVRQWLGIPYAAPPTGALRWRPPQPHASWPATLPATDPGPACPQTRGPTRSDDEDCLRLNVVAPQASSDGRLPVFVWIYGGAFNEGADSLYDGTHLAIAGHMVFVAVNYRVGVLGFLAHHALGAHAGDYGLQDQQAALRWVRRNIAAFGGDPGNVTIAGQSAGGSSVCDQLASPTAGGLFQKAISESGEYNTLLDVHRTHTPQDCKTSLPGEAAADTAGTGFAAALGCGPGATGDVAGCLRSAPVSAVLAAQREGLGTQAPIIDGATLTTQPQRAFATGRVNAKAAIMGVGRDENLQGVPRTADQYTALVDQQYGDAAPDVLRRYPLSRFPSPYVAFRTVAADSDTVCPALFTDERLARSMRVYAYENDDAGAPLLTGGGIPSLPNGVYHAAEIPFLFPGFPGAPTLDPDQQVLADQITAQWTAFARTGDPTASGTPRWASFTPGRRAVMSLRAAGDSELTDERTVGASHDCAFWRSVARRR